MYRVCLASWPQRTRWQPIAQCMQFDRESELWNCIQQSVGLLLKWSRDFANG